MLNLVELGDQGVKLVVVELCELDIKELMDGHVAEQVCGIGF